MRHGQSLSALTARLLVQLEGYLGERKPDFILGHGDTTTCFATALASFYHQIPFYHVEAGLRTNRLENPFPEEFNRQCVSSLAQHHFAPTPLEEQNLVATGISPRLITVVGSTVHDAIDLIMRKGETSSNELPFTLLGGQKIVTVTLHRREGLNSLEGTLQGIRVVSQARKDALFICPIHPNPRVQSIFKDCLSGLDNVRLVDPLSYPAFLNLLMRTKIILTDSGGVQEEGAFFGKPTLVARTETERRDGMTEGHVSLIGTDAGGVISSLNEFLDKDEAPRARRPVGRCASELIADQIVRMVQ